MASFTALHNGRAEQLRRWQGLTTGVLLVGYAGYYLCRSNLAVAGPLLLHEFGGRGFDKAALGLVSSAGVLAYAVGKLLTGVAGDFIGGKRMFLAGMIGSIVATVAFGAAGGLAAFVVIWSFNRFMQSMGWGALVKLAAHWFAPERCGRIMAILSLSFLFGDAVGRLALGTLMNAGAGLAGRLHGRRRGADRDRDRHRHPAPEQPARRRAARAARQRAQRVRRRWRGIRHPMDVVDLLAPYVRSPGFWLVCLISFGLTLVREAFNAWTPTYLVETYGYSNGAAAQLSALVPLMGGISAVLVGVITDRAGAANRLLVAVPLLAGATMSLAVIAAGLAQGPAVGLVMLSASAFLLIGPYTLLAGAIAVDLGGRRGAATAAGLIDTAGYLGAVLSGYAVGLVAQGRGWSSAFWLLAVVTALATAASAIHIWRQSRSARHVQVAHAR